MDRIDTYVKYFNRSPEESRRDNLFITKFFNVTRAAIFQATGRTVGWYTVNNIEWGEVPFYVLEEYKDLLPFPIFGKILQTKKEGVLAAFQHIKYPEYDEETGLYLDCIILDKTIYPLLKGAFEKLSAEIEMPIRFIEK